MCTVGSDLKTSSHRNLPFEIHLSVIWCKFHGCWGHVTFQTPEILETGWDSWDWVRHCYSVLTLSSQDWRRGVDTCLIRSQPAWSQWWYCYNMLPWPLSPLLPVLCYCLKLCLRFNQTCSVFISFSKYPTRFWAVLFYQSVFEFEKYNLFHEFRWCIKIDIMMWWTGWCLLQCAHSGAACILQCCSDAHNVYYRHCSAQWAHTGQWWTAQLWSPSI